MEGVLHAVRQSRFAPAQRPGGQVVAVNMVWLFARTTVKASQRTVDLGIPLTRPVLACAAAGRQAGRPAAPKAPASQETCSQEPAARADRISDRLRRSRARRRACSTRC